MHYTAQQIMTQFVDVMVFSMFKWIDTRVYSMCILSFDPCLFVVSFNVWEAKMLNWIENWIKSLVA